MPKYNAVRMPSAVTGIERADADAQLVVRGERPAVSRADHALVDPDLELLAGPGRMHLQPAGERRVGRLHELTAEVALPAEGVDDQRRRHVAAVGVHHVPRPPVDLRR